ncbi:hypothetical protein KC865_04915 [Candidatus Kaiserbacteria bacterium]|nr:hypothetical protein [Candidatus Kaiserbacteria bacterium]USN92144.1 MAG: hypothetical protein H6782_04700 [Candidatus Nomurabacteria bacterium]
MSQKSIILVVTLFALLVVGMFIYAHLKKGEIQQEAPVDVTPIEKIEDSNKYPDITRVDAKHYFIDGVHTLVGEINFPTPCDLLEAKATIQESYPERVVINFDVINNSDTCVQVVTAQRFKVEASASDSATFSALFMGRNIELNLIPASEGESPDEFELFIKG